MEIAIRGVSHARHSDAALPPQGVRWRYGPKEPDRIGRVLGAVWPCVCVRESTHYNRGQGENAISEPFLPAVLAQRLQAMRGYRFAEAQRTDAKFTAWQLQELVRELVCTGNQYPDYDGWWTMASRPSSGARAASRLSKRVLTADLFSPAAVPAPEGASRSPREAQFAATAGT